MRTPPLQPSATPVRGIRRLRVALVACLGLIPGLLAAAEPAVVLNVWPGTPPGETKPLPPEADITKPTDALIGGRRIINIGSSSTRVASGNSRTPPRPDTDAVLPRSPRNLSELASTSANPTA